METNAFKEVFVHVILPQLTPLDAINMTRVSQYYLSAITMKKCISIINERIENILKRHVFQNEYDNVIQVLVKHNIMLSGSFIFNSICELDASMNADIIIANKFAGFDV